MTGIDSALMALMTMLSSFALVLVVRELARRRSWLDVPVARSAHDVPTPTIGGLGIIGAIVITSALGQLAGTVPVPGNPSLAGAILLVATISLCDDVWNLPALPRLAVHVTAAVLVVTGVGDSSWLLLCAGAFWIAGFINAFNFMDGSDGIAGVHALVVGVAWIVIGLSQGEPTLTWVGLMVSSACAGFLILNWSPASVFMGDVGATFLGVLLASAPWLTAEPARWFAPAILTTWPFWFDAGLTLADRVRRREYLGAGHQDHIYQRLIRTGWSHQRVAVFYGLLAAAGAAAAILAVRGFLPMGIALAASSAIALVTIVRAVEKRPPAAIPITASGPGPQSTS